MVSIYGIEDINDLIYVGSTKQKYLSNRLSKHRDYRKRNIYCSSSKLNLDYCIIYELERCNEENRKEREQYWINKLDCVNENNPVKDENKQKEWRVKNKEHLLEYKRQYQKNNREKFNIRQREYRRKKKQENTK